MHQGHQWYGTGPYNYGRKAVLYGDGVQRLQPYAMDNSCAMELVRKYGQNHEWQWVAAPRTRRGQLARDGARAHALTWRMWSESQRRRSAALNQLTDSESGD